MRFFNTELQIYQNSEDLTDEELKKLGLPPNKAKKVSNSDVNKEQPK